MERQGIITIKGNPITLVGNELKVGDKAPEFTVLDSSLNEVKLSDFKGKVKIISVTPSLDTPVCDMQLKRFEKEASSMSDNVVVINISVDLPFAISRFCGASGISKAKAYSDHRYLSFGQNYGLLIKELRLLARAIIIIDKDDVVRYFELVSEVTNHPDYDKALSTLKEIS
ncbi:MAG: thiol peroxidase [Thermodesulfovibrionales bacterium]|nr:thiol peroxidase [Thermodesulfovibrionales bacterium]